MKQYLEKLVRHGRDQSGITGLETAIILIAFVVVASVFAFTVLSTGIFSAERGKETVFAGLQEARGTIAPRGSLVANGLKVEAVSLANAAWTSNSSTNVTSTLETTDNKEGSGSAEFEIDDAFPTGLIVYENLSATIDLTDQPQLSLWVKSTTTTVAGQLELVMDETAACVSPEIQTDIPALVANTWTLVTAAITDSAGAAVANASKNAITCVGIEIETAFTTNNITLNVDEVVVPGLLTSVVLNITNAVEGEPVDLTAPSDSGDDGVADSDGNHVMVITYTDKNQIVRDLYWEKSFLGDNDSDDLLETGERAKLTIYLKGLADATPLVKSEGFSIEIKPAKGSVIVVDRRSPPVIDTVMNMN